MNASFEGSPHEADILMLTRYAHKKNLKVERIHGPALSNAGRPVKQLYGYDYSVSPNKIIYVVCH